MVPPLWETVVVPPALHIKHGLAASAIFPFLTLQTPRQNPFQAHTKAVQLFKITPSYPLLQKEGNNTSQSMVYTS